MNILITGATGLVGHHLCLELCKNNHHVTVLCRSKQKAQSELLFPFKFVQWDFKSPLPSGILQNIDAVIHLAGEPIAVKRWSAAQKRKIMESRTLSTQHITEALSKHSEPITYLCASAIGYYSLSDEVQTELRYEKKIDEKTSNNKNNGNTGSNFLRTTCQAWEEASQIKKENVSTITLRIGAVLSSRGGLLKKLQPVFQSALAGPIGNGQQWLSWIHLKDLVRLILFLVENKKTGVYNATSPYPCTNKTFTQTLAQTIGRPAVLPVPKTVLQLMMGELSVLATGSQRILPEKALQDGFVFTYAKINEALSDIYPMNGFHHTFENHQWFNKPLDETFKFFCDPKKLEEITPSSLQFKTLSCSTPDVKKGSLIEYKLKIRGAPIKWKTLITEFDENKMFVDIQLKGPYSLWHHTHQFTPANGGTIVSDQVYYRLPMGIVGEVFAGNFVKKDVEKIFSFRKEKMKEIF